MKERLVRSGHCASRECRRRGPSTLALRGIDVRNHAAVAQEVLAFIEAAGSWSVVMTDRIIGCPHEEGFDHQSSTCPACSFWAGRNRGTGKRLH